MPFPWKKNKVKRISRIVAGLPSPKRGGSLVVETGFPTSLIDLVVKNRERFERTRNRKLVRVQVSDPVHQDAPSPPPPSPTTLQSLNGNSLVVSPVVVQTGPTEVESLSRRGGDSAFDGGVSVEDQNHVEESASGTDWGLVFVAFLKIVMVVGLALSTKKLTVGITTSASLLLFVEYIGRRFGCYLKCGSDAKKWIKSLTQMVSNFLLLIKFVMLWKRTDGCESEINVSRFAVASNSSISEIEVLETLEVMKSKVDEAVSSEKICNEDEIILSNRDNVLDCLEMKESEREVLQECEDCVSRSKLKLNTRLNSKLIKKFVPKKWRSTKKERKNRKKEAPKSSSPNEINLGYDKSGKSDETGNRGQDDGTELPFLKIGECCDEQQSKDNNGIACGLLMQATREVDVNYAKQRNSGYAILFLIVLAGLLFGRVLALLLVMAWCVVLKFSVKRRRLAKNAL